jgi:hypothetical protein
MFVLGKKRARPVRVTRRDPHLLVSGRHERSDAKLQRTNAFVLAAIERDRPAGAAARAGMPATVFGVDTQTLGHVTLSNIIVMPITGPSVGPGVRRADPRKSGGIARRGNCHW